MSLAVLLLTPKCPLCLAAWVAAASGVTVSASTAGQLRALAIVASSTMLFALTMSVFVRRVRMGSRGVTVDAQKLGGAVTTYEKMEVIGTPS